MDLYKLVVRDKTTKVIQIHEVYFDQVGTKVVEIMGQKENGDFRSVTISKLNYED